ncbi:MAG: hypothetical protein LUG50_11355 [Planctomycetaceae bacterium]|nr:hypothetical protein [Planctomycetaceae bacterium]
MDESPVINDSEEFVPLDPARADVPPEADAGEYPPDAVPDAAPEDVADAPPDQAEGAPPEAADGDGGGRVIDPQQSYGFIPLAPGSAPSGAMPTPDRVIHMHDPKRLDTVPFEFADIRALAQRILKRAQEQGIAKIEAARKQVAEMEKAASDKAYKEAYPKGHEEGFAKGEKEGAAKAEEKIQAAIKAEQESLRTNAAPVAETMKAAVEAMNAAKEQLLQQAEGDLLLLALDLAKRLVGTELRINPEAIRPIAVECIGLVTDRADITVRVNPEDYRIMEDFYPDLKVMFPDLGPIRVVPDENVDRGGIIAATRESEVDMQLATRLAAFEEVILGFSEEEATAPWSAIPPEAIAQAKAASQESSFSLYDDDGEPGEAPPPGEYNPDQFDEYHPENSDLPDAHPTTDAGPPDAAAASDDGAAPVPDENAQPETATPPPDDNAQAGAQPAAEPGADPSGQPDDAFMAQSDLADLAELAEMAGAEGEPGGGEG